MTRVVVDLAADGADAGRTPDGTLAKVVFLHGDTVVGDLLAGPSDARDRLDPPADVRRKAREVAWTRRLRPLLAPATALRPPTVSVVICTLRRPAELASCLASVAALRTPPLEIVIVNNDPADAGPRALGARAGARVVDEPRRGLSAARNAGIAAATGEIVAFIDDDCRVHPAWLDELALELADPLVAAIVGYVGPAELDTEAQWLFEAQGGFEHRFEEFVADGARQGPWAAAGLGDGNSFFRRSAFERLGGFAENLGPGTPARSAQDAELFQRLLRAGLRVKFSPARIVWHRHRRQIGQLAGTLEGYTTGLAAHAAMAMVHRRDPAALALWRWWFGRYFPALARGALRDRRPGRSRLLAVQARGAVLGPWRARQAVRRGPAVAPVAARGPAPEQSASVLDEPPPVAVVLASRDRRERLIGTLDALRAQRFPPERIEVVVVLDGSTDGSAAALRSFGAPWPLRVVEQPPAGLATSRNRGIAAARHDLVVLLDDDIVPRPGLLAAHAAAHAGAPRAIVMGYHPATVDERDWWALGVRAWWEDHFRRKLHAGWQPGFVDYCDGNSSLSRALLRELGGFDEAFSGGRRQDWELAARALPAGVELRMEPRARADHHPDASFAASLRAARQEGAYDVVLVRRHPQAAGRLPLGALRGLPTGPTARAAAIDPAVWVRAEALLRRANARRAWSRVTALAMSLAYAGGVRDALAEPAELDALLAPVRADRDVLDVAVDLDGGPLRVPGRHLGRVRLALPSPRGTLAVPTSEAGETWDAEAVLRRAARALAAADG